MGKNKNTKTWRIRSMFLKELNLIKNDKFALLLVFVLPTMIMGTLYVAINESLTSSSAADDSGKTEDALVMGVVDADPTDTFPGEDLSENFTFYLSTSPDLVVLMYNTEGEALDGLYRDILDAYAVIPYGFEGNITGDIPAFVGIHISSTNFASQSAVFSAFNAVVNRFRYDHGWIKGEVAMNRVLEFKPTGDYVAATFGAFMIVFGVFIPVSATAAQAIVGDVPLSRMLLTPATRLEAIIAKTLAYFVVGLLQAAFLLALWMILFAIVPNSHPVNLYLILALMSLSGSALGMLISTLVTTRLQANQSFLFLLFSSMIVGTGFMDVGIFDDVYPLNLGRRMLTDVAFKGRELIDFSGEIMLILEFSLGLVILSWLIFSRKRTLA